MRRIALFFLLCGIASAPSAFAQDHFAVGAYADYFRLSQTDTNFAGVGAGGNQAFQHERFSLPEDLALNLNQIENALLAESEQFGKRPISEGIALRGSLNFHKLAFIGHHDVEIDIG